MVKRAQVKTVGHQDPSHKSVKYVYFTLFTSKLGTHTLKAKIGQNKYQKLLFFLHPLVIILSFGRAQLLKINSVKRQYLLYMSK